MHHTMSCICFCLFFTKHNSSNATNSLTNCCHNTHQLNKMNFFVMHFIVKRFNNVDSMQVTKRPRQEQQKHQKIEEGEKQQQQEQ